jgi:hypothetical protein
VGTDLSVRQYICGPEKRLRFRFLCSSVVCFNEEYVTASTKDLVTHLHLDNEKYKEYVLGSSWNIVRLFRELLVEVHSDMYARFFAT